MSLHEFVRTYFFQWRIAQVITCGTDCGHIVLRDNETLIKIFFTLNGDINWTGKNVTIDHIEGCDF